MKQTKRSLRIFSVLVIVVGFLAVCATAAMALEKIFPSGSMPSGQTAQTAGPDKQNTLAQSPLPPGHGHSFWTYFQQSSMHQKILHTLLAVAFSYIFIFILVGTINRRVTNVKARHVLRKNVIYIINILLCLIILVIWIHNIGSLTIFLGFASAGMALALQEALLCMAGWFLIVFRRPFEVGDRIEMGSVKGDVIDIRLFQTSLLEIGNWVDADNSTGRIANIPNSAVFKKETFNYSKGFEFIWNEIPILVTFESDWRRAQEIILQCAQEFAEGQEVDIKKKIDMLTNRYMIFYEKLGPRVYVNIKESGIELTLRYLTEAKKRRSTQDQICQAILTGFGKEQNVNFAYPTYRIVKT